MKIGIPINPMQNNYEKMLEFASNFDYIELSFDGMRKEELEDLKIPNVFVVHLPFRYIAYSSIYPELQEKSLELVCDLIRIGSRMGAKIFVAHPIVNGVIKHKKGLEKTFEAVRESTEKLSECIKEMNLKIAFENMSLRYPLFNKPDDFKLLNINNICFDSSHSESCGIKSSDWIKSAEKIGLRINHIHLSGYDGKTTHTSLEDTNFDFESFSKSLKGINYNGTITLEMRYASFEVVEKTKERIRNSFKS